jgi:tetratricopeptide (TPR) repeat protein
MKGEALYEPAFIGREVELAKLKGALNAAATGKGSSFFIAGEAGIGKTRLVSELIKEAESKNARIIRGWCLAESLEPLMSIKTALREAGLFHIISGDPPPLVVSAYLTNNAGIIIAKSEREELKLDPDIFASMLNAVGMFVKDSLRMIDQVEKTGGMNILGYKEYKIVLEESNGLHLACVTRGPLSELLVSDMRALLSDIHKRFGDALVAWDGDSDKVKDVVNMVSGLITSGRFNGKSLVDDPKIRQENLFDNVLLGFRRLSSEKPIMLFLDDLQWADPTTLALIHYLSRNTKGDRMLMVGAYRPEDVARSWDGKTHQLETAMQNMNRDSLLERLELNRLDSDHSKRVVESALGATLSDKTLENRIYRETDGNPFFILEVVKLLVEEGAIAKNEDGTWNLVTEVDKLDIPSKVYDVVKRRLDRLMEEQRRILDCASVVGDEFQSDVVGKVVKIEKLHLLENLSKLEKTHRLVYYLKDKYRFDHAKVRDVLYNGISDELKREYHRIIGDTIAELHKDNHNDVIDQLAHHYYEAKDERASEYLIKMGKNAWHEASTVESARAYTMALEMTKNPCMRIEGLIGLIDVHLFYGEFKLAGKNIKEAATYVKDCRDKRLEAKLCLREGNLKRRIGDIDEAKILFEKGLHIYKAIGDKEGVADAYNILASDAYSRGNYDGALEIITNSLQIEKERGNNGRIAEVYRHMGLITTSLGDYNCAMDCLEKSRLMSKEMGNKRTIIAVLNNMADIAQVRGNNEEGIRLLEMVVKTYNEIKKEYDLYHIYYNKAKIADLKHDHQKAIEYYGEGLRLCEDKGDKLGGSYFYKKISDVYIEMGDFAKALEYAKQYQKISDAIDDKFGKITSLQHNAGLYFRNDEYDKALKCCKDSLKIAKSIKAHRRMVIDYCKMAEIYLKLNDVNKALDNAKEGLAIALRIKTKLEEGMCHRFLGMVYRERKEYDKAVEEFEKATALFDSMKVVKERAYVDYEYALLFKATGKSSEAKEHLGKARSEFERMGLMLMAEKCRKALEGL